MRFEVNIFLNCNEGDADVRQHTCAKAKPPKCKRRPAQERELEFENPGRQNLRGFCEGCEDSRGSTVPVLQY